MIKKTLSGMLLFATVAALVTGIAVLCSVKDKSIAKVNCQGVKVAFTNDYGLVNEDDVRKALAEKYGSFVGQKLDSVNLTRIESILDAQPGVGKSEAYTSSDGFLNIMISQQKPVMVLMRGSDSLYVDSQGCIFPARAPFSKPLPHVQGYVPVHCCSSYRGQAETEKEAEWILHTLDLIQYIKTDKTWKSLVEDYFVARNGDLVLRMKSGKEKFIIGEPVDIEAKFAKIARYYEYIRPSKPQGHYSTVNVKYRRQIVCKK